MLDAQRALAAVQQRYESRAQGNVCRWLAALSERIVYYGQVFDMLAQHHPEYVALAWGAFKFVFQVGWDEQGMNMRGKKKKKKKGG